MNNKPVYTSGPAKNLEKTLEFALEKAAQKEGLKTTEQFFTLANKVDQDLEKLQKEAEELGPEGMLQLQRTLRARAHEDAKALSQLHAVRAIIERIPNWENSDYKTQHDEAVKRITAIGKKNPYAVPLGQKQARKHAFERRQVYRGEVEEIKADTISLTEACQGKEGSVAVSVQLLKKDGGTLRGWVRLEVKGGKARIESTTSTVKFLQKYGTTEEGIPIWVNLLPPNFWTPYGEPFFPKSLRKAMAKLYQDELSGEEVPEEVR